MEESSIVIFIDRQVKMIRLEKESRDGGVYCGGISDIYVTKICQYLERHGIDRV